MPNLLIIILSVHVYEVQCDDLVTRIQVYEKVLLNLAIGNHASKYLILRSYIPF